MKRSAYLLLLTMLMLFMTFFYVGCTKPPSTDPLPPNHNNQTADNNQAGKDNERTGDLKPGDFFPLTNGSFWDYLGEGMEYATFNRQVIYADNNLAQVREDNGGTVSASVYQVTSEAVTRVFFQGEAYEDSNFLGADPNDNTIIIKAPLEVGNKWGIRDGTREIIALNADIDTPAGNFKDCLGIKISYSSGSVSYEYFKAGIGMVKREFKSNGETVTSSLEDYKVNNLNQSNKRDNP
ncbi:MAG: hypothetical protein GX207_07815 [Peptococcaceae bacterium]|nr:hypothetical protein [Peptococcaceae bacterium]